MGTNEGTNFSNRQIPYGFVVVLAQELRIREPKNKNNEAVEPRLMEQAMQLYRELSRRV